MQVDIGIGAFVAIIPGAEGKKDTIGLAAILDVMAILLAGRETDRISGLQDRLALIADQHGFALKHDDQLVLMRVPMALGRPGARGQPDLVGAKLADPGSPGQAPRITVPALGVEGFGIGRPGMFRQVRDPKFAHGCILILARGNKVFMLPYMVTLSPLANPVGLAKSLIRKPSITPTDAGALDVLQAALEELGFSCRRLPFGEVDNLYARRGTAEPCFMFAGHTDVVPPGAEAEWQKPPFAADEEDGVLWGRGAADMKGALAAMVAAVARHLDSRGGEESGSIAFLITGDEEGPAINGTKAVLKALEAEGETFTHCLVGEPTNPTAMGETIKSGRRGSLNCTLTVTGRQGHVAYPERAENPIPPLMALLARLKSRVLDEGHPPFQPSNLEITTVDVGNPTTNVIPAEASARFNIRFNIRHTGDELSRWIRDEAALIDLDFDGSIKVDIHVTGEAFLTPAGEFTTLLQDCVMAETGKRPALTTGGGTSDARFIHNYGPVAEFGLVGATMHQVNERVPVADIDCLTRIYTRILDSYFRKTPA